MFEKIADYCEKFGDKMGIVLEDLKTGEKLEKNPDISFSSASLIKYPIMWSLFEQVSEGKIDLQEVHTLVKEDKAGSSVYDSSVLRELHEGIPLTLEDCLNFMIVISDDTATNIIMKKLGFETMNASFERLGLKGTKAGRLMMDYEGLEHGRDNFISAGDMNRLSEILCRDEILDHTFNQKMLGILLRQRHNDAVNKHYPMDIPYAHKGGCIRQYGIDHDCGILYKDGKPAVLVNVCTRFVENSRDEINHIGDMLYECVYK